MRIKNNYKLRLILLAALTLLTSGTAGAQISPDVASLRLNQPRLIQYLKDGRRDAFRTIDVAGLVYPSAVYIRAIDLCRNLRTADIPNTELTILSDPAKQAELIGLNANLGEIKGAVLQSVRAMSFHGQGLRDAEQVIKAHGCEGSLTRLVVGTAEAIIAERLEDKRKRQITEHETRIRIAAFERNKQERQAIYEKNLYAGKLELNQTFQNKGVACRAQGSQNRTCMREARQQFRQDLHILETGLQYSPAYNFLVSIIEGLGRRAGGSDACKHTPIATPRADIAALAEQFHPEHVASLLDSYDVAHNWAYQHKMDAFEMYDWQRCPEDTLERTRPVASAYVKKQLDEWIYLNHGLPNHQPH